MKQRLLQFASVTSSLVGRKRTLFFPITLFFKTPLFEGFFLACRKTDIAPSIARGEL